MLGTIIITLLAVPIGLFVFNEVIGYLKVQKYKKQGIKEARYVPLPKFVMIMRGRYLSKDPFGDRKKRMTVLDHNQPFSVLNAGKSCHISLNSEKAAKEFFAKEIDVSIKESYMPDAHFLGFFFKNGKEAQDQRAIFAKIFHYSNIVSMLPGIRATIRNHVKKLKQKVVQAGGELKVDLKKEFSASLFDDLTGVILFKAADNKLADKFEGMSVTQIVQKMFKVYIENAFIFVNRLPFAAALGLNKQLKELQRLQKGLRKIIRNEYEKRYNSATLDDKCILDIMIRLNKESERETGEPKFTIEEISSMFEMFQFAASDTSYHFSTSALCFLAQEENHKYQERLVEELLVEFEDRPDYSSEELSSLKVLDMVFNETGRIANSAAGIAERTVIKDFNLCGYKIHKGDKIRHFLFNFQPEYFKNPYKFNPDRFDTESPDYNKVPKLRHTPFSHGQRSCIGRYLGEMMVKLVVAELLKYLKVSVESGYKIEFGLQPIYVVRNPDLILKVRGSQ